MPKVTLNLPATFPFSTDIDVRISDINYGGHMGNDSLLSIFHEARVRFLKSLGYSEKDIEGVGIMMTDAVLVYAAEVFHGDTISVAVTAEDFRRAGCDFYYRATNKETGDEVARGKTGVVFFDYEKKRLMRTPEAFRAALGE
ncbi:MAG: thioesterase family protein [Verrucomicrobia bacterium]|nr:thioesterase family protein [Verrucomicrobiota bacterium]